MALMRVVLWVFGLLVLELATTGKSREVAKSDQPKCAFPAVYTFGDSHADTGGFSAALGPIPPPNGGTFFKKPSGRLSDGRLVVDLLADYLGLPFESAYLDSIGTNFQHGANFASVGSSVGPSHYSPFHLPVQVSQFIQFKNRSADLYKNRKDLGRIPKPGDFSKSLYTVDIGHNDLIFGFLNPSMTDGQVGATIPSILDQYIQSVLALYNEGARSFLLHNVGPIGCSPFGAAMYPPKNATFDKNRCAVSQNDVVQEFNRQLKERVVQLRAQLPDAALTYVDVYAAKFSLIDNAKNEGFDDPWNFCCGSLSPIPVFCGTQMEYNKTVYYGSACDDPTKHISWDGIHFTDAANQWLVKKIVDGSVSDPPVPVNQACP